MSHTGSLRQTVQDHMAPASICPVTPPAPTPLNETTKKKKKNPPSTVKQKKEYTTLRVMKNPAEGWILLLLLLPILQLLLQPEVLICDQF